MAAYQFTKTKAPTPKPPAGKQPAAKKPPPKKPPAGSSGSDFDSKHPRGKAGSGKGGQFVALSYNSSTNTGTGYGSKQGDSRVKKLQEALNRLGLKDKNGEPLVVDGKLGPLTTSSVIAAQRKLGIKPADGKVTPALLSKLTGSKSLSGGKAKTTGKKPMKRSQLARKRKPLKKKPAKPVNAAQARKPTVWDRQGRRPPGNYRPNSEALR